MELVIRPNGKICCMYGEAIDLAALGKPEIRRASRVEPDELARWWADLAPVGVSLALAAPTILPSSVFGADAPSNRITVGVVGWGMQGPGNTGELLRLNDVRVVAACDLDKNHLKAAVDTIRERMQEISRNAELISQFAAKSAGNAGISAELRGYLSAAGPRFVELKKLADAVVEKAGKLGELKVDEVKQALRVEDPILVMGEKDYRVIAANQVWQVDDQAVRAYVTEGKVKPMIVVMETSYMPGAGAPGRAPAPGVDSADLAARAAVLTGS